MNVFIIYFILLFTLIDTCHIEPKQVDVDYNLDEVVLPGANQWDSYIDLLKDRRVAGVFNQTSLIGNVHIVDTLLSSQINLKQIFTLEHGFRGSEDAGSKIKDDIDIKTGIPLISLYGKAKKPSKDALKDIDVVIFDVQDVGVRFYTYISTLHYVIEACAENGVEVLILDRPNPNGHYVDGPVLNLDFQSFVGMHPIPVVYGMTIGELANMIVGEQWIDDAAKLKYTVIPCENYSHDTRYDLPVKPSPNLPNFRSILMYPSLCFFEGTDVSVGRGTDQQFQIIGHPALDHLSYSFTPKPSPGALSPKHSGKQCYGVDLTNLNLDSLYSVSGLNISYLIQMHESISALGIDFFTSPSFFDKLAGSDQLRKNILELKTAEEIKKSWQQDLDLFKIMRRKYLLYD